MLWIIKNIVLIAIKDLALNNPKEVSMPLNKPDQSVNAQVEVWGILWGSNSLFTYENLLIFIFAFSQNIFRWFYLIYS